MENEIISDSDICERYDLSGRKAKAKEIMKNYSSNQKNEELLNKLMELDDTLPQMYYEKLKLNSYSKKNNYKLREKSYDILDKEKLKEFGMIKKYNYKEIYFKIINYIEEINLNESDNDESGFEKEDFEEEEKEDIEDNEESENNNSESSFNESKIKEENFINKTKITHKDDIIYDNEIEDILQKNVEDDNLSDSQFKEIIIKKENFDIETFLIKVESVNIKEIKKIFNNIYNGLYDFFNYRNNYPDFESEYFFFHNIRYMLETFKKLKYKKFIRKIHITKFIRIFTKKMMNNEITDELIKIFYYYIINTQYHFDFKLLELLITYNEKEICLFNNNKDYYVKNNTLFNKNNELVLENLDYYSINKLLLFEILKIPNKDISIFKTNCYSIKGVLMNIPFAKEPINNYWKEFLSSSVLDDVVKKLFKNNENIFKEQIVINLFQKMSFYFPNFNDDFFALSHKDLLFIYFSPRNIIVLEKDLQNSTSLIKMINKSLNKVDIQHEWGHISLSFLYFSSKTNYFDTAERKIQLLKKDKDESKLTKKEIYVTEGGKAVEYLLYGRVINEINSKEAIFILNSDNYKLSLEEFFMRFMNLKNEKLLDVFKTALKNENIDKCVKDAYAEYINKDKYFKLNLEDFIFKAKKREIIHSFIDLDYENITFKIPYKSHLKHSHFMKKINPYLNTKKK